MNAAPRTLYLIRRVQLLTYARLEQALDQFDLTVGQYTLLSLLAQRTGMSAAQLSRRFAVTPQSMTEMITALDKKRLIRRRTAPANRRILLVSLTAAGRALTKRCEAVVDQVEADLLAKLSAAELAAFRHTLRTLLEPRTVETVAERAVAERVVAAGGRRK